MNKNPFIRSIHYDQAPPSDLVPIGSRLVTLVKTNRFREVEARDADRAFREMLKGGWLDVFGQALDQVQAALTFDQPAQRRWALECIWALVDLEDLSMIPEGTLKRLRDCVGRTLLAEEPGELQHQALETLALMLGIEAAQAGLDGVVDALDGLERSRPIGGAELTARIRTSRNFALPALERFFQEGQEVLDQRVLPFYHFLGDGGAYLLIQLLEEEGNLRCRSRIMDLLRHLGPLSLPALKRGLVKGSWHLMRNALNLVADLEATEAFEYVVPCLEHPDRRVLHAAVKALVKTGGTKAERYLVELLPVSSPDRQLELLQGLGQIPAASAVPVLQPLAASGAESVRIKAVEILGLTGAPEALPILVEVLRRKGRIFRTAEPLPVRLACVRALVVLGSAEALAALSRLLAAEPKGPDKDALVHVAKESALATRPE